MQRSYVAASTAASRGRADCTGGSAAAAFPQAKIKRPHNGRINERRPERGRLSPSDHDARSSPSLLSTIPAIVLTMSAISLVSILRVRDAIRRSKDCDYPSTSLSTGSLSGIENEGVGRPAAHPDVFRIGRGQF